MRSFRNLVFRSVSVFLANAVLFGPVAGATEDGVRTARETRELFSQYLGEEVRIRDRERRGVYFVPAHSEPDRLSWRSILNRVGDWVGAKSEPRHRRVVENSSGFRISDHNSEQFREKMGELVDALGAEAINGHLFQTGLTREENANPQVGAYLRSTLEELGVSESEVQIKKIWVPTGTGLKRAWQELLYFPILRQDYQAPITAEVVGGLTALMATELSSAVYVIQTHDAEVWIPLLLSHFGLLGGVTILRRTVENWQNRSLSAISGYLKQGLLSGMFITNYSLVIAWREIWNFIQTNGVAASARAFPRELLDFVIEKGPITALQTTFFTAYFVSGVFRYSKVRSATSEGAREIRDSAPWITGLTFFITSPLLIAATSSPGFMNTGRPNLGEWGLIVAAGIGLSLARHIRKNIETRTTADGETQEYFVRPTVLDWVSAAISKVFRFRSEVRHDASGAVCEGAFARLNRFVQWRNPQD